ncbi:aminotransferase class V-fold PLP-dependent enzyme [Paenibacillus polymyxa]|uniref:aminotransferase class V-fold PLP-dependent enzyme n=1 Tax=Paenibacillus TaxID=44249 RepID=UPI00042EE41F|nr:MULTISPECIES: aminotransferase class V-fold PLP-dependent enzyme [Paenibacillus]AHM67995.1 aminotransferase ycbu [Paenibacillus polymyxa SQR-21]AIY08701.1 aminotransferase [Paenibacillus polymyxa]KAF6654656.1 aminotransferase class V-fold PLP-dependent enzyme [Paenibacillus sp. EKM301P]RPD99454.1 aminotransferase class V-fold PLP-dependent enzyme [Paenibacillus polymyxa]UBS86633.1 aminotransferase class V-fold PLP-dependent enzyme [Paenibacillus polymyxa]
MKHPFQSYRQLFPVLSSHIHVGSCSQGAISRPVSAAIEEYHRSLLQHGHNGDLSMARLEEARGHFAKLIGAEPDEIAVLSSASEAIAGVATALSYVPGKEGIVYADTDFPTVGHIWQAQEMFRDHICCIPSTEGEVTLEQYEEHVTENTALIMVSHVNYTNGFQQDLKSIAHIAHRNQALLFVDAYQSAGMIPIDVKAMGIDMLVAGARKYMLGIPGVAFLYISKERIERFKPRLTGWLGQESASRFDIAHPVPAAGARRFETGLPSFISIFAANAALKLLLEIGVTNIQTYMNELLDFSIEYGRSKGLHIRIPDGGDTLPSLLAIEVADVSAVERHLRSRNMIVSARKDVIRVAPHFYNTAEEVRRVLDELGGSC